MHQKPTVHILLATYNGARYLDEQLQSIARQKHNAWTLTVSDDGSTDDTLCIVQRFATQVIQPVSILRGPGLYSSTANFCHLLEQASIDNPEDLYAFCDQDDVWHEEKLERAVQWHAQHNHQNVRLYCCRTQFVDERLHPIGLSPSIKRTPSFGNAVIQNIASGNTMVLSQSLLTAQKIVRTENSVWHDWTCYIVATALGGIVWFDDQPCLLYRQHAGNIIGSNDKLKNRILHLKPIFQGRFKHWCDLNNAAIYDIYKLLTPEAKDTHARLEKIRTSSSRIVKILTFIKSNIRRQSILSNTILIIGIFLKMV